jgi:release factor glutamine methyltransferase
VSSTVEHWLEQATNRLEAAGVGSATLDAELILGHALGRSRAWLKAHSEEVLEPSKVALAKKSLQRRLDREPLVHITGTREFYGLEFEITPDVLTPRAETEQMADWAIKYAPKNSRLIDVGTGSGAIAVAIAKHRSDLEITATDISDRELEVARRNAGRHGAEINLVVSDLWSGCNFKRKTHGANAFQTVVTNLPYLRDDADLMPEVRREPGVALHGGPDGLGLYRRFLAGTQEHLAPGGHLFTESDPWQHPALIAEAAKYGLRPVEQGYFILGFEFVKRTVLPGG